MTQEEKAKAYDKALNWMRELYPGLHGATKEDAEHYFPELRESEDERIRKKCIELIKRVIPSGDSQGQESKEILDCIAYLEKQKYDRMKPIYDARESFESALEKAWNDYHNGYENVDKLEDDYVECAHAKGFREGYLFGIEKQKEQNEITIEQVYKEFINPEKLKGAKTNKYIRAQLLWELMHNGIITAVDYQYLTDDKRKPWTEEEYLKAYRKGFDVSEQLKQKDQNHDGKKWIYEDDYNKDMERCFNDGKDEVLENLEKYGLQKEQKPSIFPPGFGEVHWNPIPSAKKELVDKPAWSEEDEAMIKSILFVLESYVSKAECEQSPALTATYPTYYKEIDWLKSIRPLPHWKPSEHQMNILKAVKEYVGRGSGYWGEGLGSLIEDLEKLM
jgi:hypothetical protein